MKSILSMACKCPGCGWAGTVLDCEPDIDDDGGLGCPECLCLIEHEPIIPNPDGAGRIIVTFDIWGQRSYTIFDENSELDPLVWLDKMQEFGWLHPIEVRQEDGVLLHNEQELQLIFYR